MRTVLLLASLLLFNTANVTAAEPGIEVGSEAPDFELSDQNGQKHKLSDLVKKSKVALVFYRSANW